jgi:hypothetical protein
MQNKDRDADFFQNEELPSLSRSTIGKKSGRLVTVCLFVALYNKVTRLKLYCILKLGYRCHKTWSEFLKAVT